MLKNSKTSYIVPGYTGHLPKSAQREPVIPPEEPHGQIPGYLGYIESVKPENIFGQTYGEITYQINCETYHKGQDVGPELRYGSLTSSTYVNQTEVKQRTAADIVGVIPQPPAYRIPTGEHVKHVEPSPPEQTQDANATGEQQGSKYITLPQEIPGYTGHARRIAADNIYGLTFANAKIAGLESQAKIDHDRDENLGLVSGQIPKLGRANH